MNTCTLGLVSGCTFQGWTWDNLNRGELMPGLELEDLRQGSHQQSANQKLYEAAMEARKQRDELADALRLLLGHVRDLHRERYVSDDTINSYPEVARALQVLQKSTGPEGGVR